MLEVLGTDQTTSGSTMIGYLDETTHHFEHKSRASLVSKTDLGYHFNFLVPSMCSVSHVLNALQCICFLRPESSGRQQAECVWQVDALWCLDALCLPLPASRLHRACPSTVVECKSSETASIAAARPCTPSRSRTVVHLHQCRRPRYALAVVGGQAASSSLRFLYRVRLLTQRLDSTQYQHTRKSHTHINTRTSACAPCPSGAR